MQFIKYGWLKHTTVTQNKIASYEKSITNVGRYLLTKINNIMNDC